MARSLCITHLTTRAPGVSAVEGEQKTNGHSERGEPYSPQGGGERVVCADYVYRFRPEWWGMDGDIVSAFNMLSAASPSIRT